MNVIENVVPNMLLNGVVHPDILANFAENLVPGTANVFMKIPLKGREVLVQRLTVGMPPLHGLFGGNIVEIPRGSPFPVPITAPSWTLHDHFAHIATHELLSLII